MKGSRIVWYELLRMHSRPFLKFLQDGGRRSAAVETLSIKLTDFLIQSVRDRAEAAAFWHAVPAVISRCDDQETYKLEMAAEAYAWIHLLDRYTRTWIALERMVQRACLPLAIRGVNVLDVGTGPGPSVLAIANFYRHLSEYGNANNESRLVQPCNVTTVELSDGNNAFRGRFREVTMMPSGEIESFRDLRAVNPRGQRAQARDNLLDETDFNPGTGEHEPAYWPQLADWESQGLYRYRLVTICNFLTNPDVMNSTRQALEAILADLQPGAIVLVIGGTGRQYPAVYAQLDDIAHHCGLKRKMADERVQAGAAESLIALKAARSVAAHVEALSQMDEGVPPVVRLALSSGSEWGGVSGIRVYRRDRYGVRPIQGTRHEAT